MSHDTNLVPSRTSLDPVAAAALHRRRGPRRPARGGQWAVTGNLLLTETRLFLRDGPSAFFALLIPSIVLVGAGLAIPGMRTVISDPGGGWDGLTMVQAFTPSVLTMALATPALSTLPVSVAHYREQGVLRRLSTTPIRPAAVLLAQVTISLVAFLAAAMLALFVAGLVFATPAPRHLLVAVLALVLGALATFGLGLLVAARARTGSAASGLGMLLYFPLLFLAGMWTPGPMMPDLVRQVATYTPVGALHQALTAGWFGTEVPVLQFGVLLGWIGLLYPVAIRLFRWS